MEGKFTVRNGFSPVPITWAQTIHVVEVKISYPASVTASFSIRLKRGNSDSGLNQKRKLLNTNKLLFKNSGQGGIYVLVIVEPTGIVAIRHGQERQFVIFNIVCDELLFGIPHKAWWVGILVIFCLGLGFIIPYFHPSHILRKRESQRVCSEATSRKNDVHNTSCLTSKLGLFFKTLLVCLLLVGYLWW